jgi:enoyl-CoA hydratase
MINVSSNGAVATILMSRPSVNAINPAFVEAFTRVLDEVERTKPTVLVIRSNQKCFSAGADLSLIQSCFSASGGTQAMVAYVTSLHAWFNRLAAFPAVTLAAIAGPALGGGLELALACDLRIASTTATLGLPEARVGMIPGAGGTQRLPRLCGPGVAARLILGAEVIDGQEAARLGLVQWAVEPSGLDAMVATVSDRIAALSRPALLASKDCLAAVFDPNVDGFSRELEKPLTLMETADARDRIAAFFAPKPPIAAKVPPLQAP